MQICWPENCVHDRDRTPAGQNGHLKLGQNSKNTEENNVKKEEVSETEETAGLEETAGSAELRRSEENTGEVRRSSAWSRMTNRQKGVVCVLLEALGFSIMSTAIKLTGERIPVFEKALFRNLVALIFAFAVMKTGHESFRPKKGNLTGLFMRSIFGTLGIFCNFYACSVLLLANANMLNKLAPFFSILFSIFLLREKPQKVQILGVIIAFAGMLCIVQPGAFASSDFVPSVIGALGGASAGFAYTWVRKLGLHGENGTLIVFFFSAFSTLACLPLALMHFVPPTAAEMAFLVLTGLGAMMGQVFVTRAYYYAPAREISVYDYTQVIFAGFFGWILFGEIPDALSVLGYVLIIGAGVGMYLYNRRHTSPC